jgi:subtilase family serine protease
LNFGKRGKIRTALVSSGVLIPLLFISPVFASASGPVINSAPLLSAVSVHHVATLLDPKFDPLTGGVPFCLSIGRGTITCYPPSFLKKAYGFPQTTGEEGLDGSGQTVVIVDAFGSPTIQTDLNLFDKTFGLPAAAVTRLCGPTWTGASTDVCPVNTVADLSTALNAVLCGAVGWAEETTLDVTMVHGLAPGARIVLAVANDCFDTSFNTAELALASQHGLRGSIMSQSFGEPDDLVGCLTVNANNQCTSTDPTIKANADKAYARATKNHWTIIASSGDDGANTNARVLGTGELTPSWPSTNPLNLAAGGTQGSPYGGQYGPPPGHGGTFSCAAHATCNTGLVVINGGATGCTTAFRPGSPSSCTAVGYGGESAWNEFNVFGLGTSTGGGVSSLYERPSYQHGLPHEFPTLLGNSVEGDGRLTPDVSFNAAIMGGVLAPLSFLPPGASSNPPFPQWAVFGGTSASAPAWAAIIALLNQANHGPVGFINPAIYAMMQSHSQGNNRDESSNGTGPLHDITTGENSDTAGLFGVDGFKASVGYDLTTGWGTPNVAQFIQDLPHFIGGADGGD